ncbi:hypothetical protein CQ020_14220 [Arthrobacter sp. MYb23]|nr:hypothetical protein CQ038_14735 [Arthrobacter sp. MYb51]PRB94724.1 hypothetical protein CQ020_14220 [Arthrobacter sp. MYb23]
MTFEILVLGFGAFLELGGTTMEPSSTWTCSILSCLGIDSHVQVLDWPQQKEPGAKPGCFCCDRTGLHPYEFLGLHLHFSREVASGAYRPMVLLWP